MNLPIVGSMAVTSTLGVTNVIGSDDEERAAVNLVETSSTLTTGSVLLYNGYKDVKFDMELTKSYIESLSDDELYKLEQKLTGKDENIVIEETHSKSI